MRLTDVLEMSAREGMRRYAEKRAGVVLPMAIGAMIPGIAHRAIERARSTEQSLEPAAHKEAALPLQMSLPLAQLGQSLRGGAGQAGAAAGRAAAGGGKDLAGGLGKGLGALGASPLGGIAGGISGGLGKLVERKLFGQEFGQRQDPLALGGRKAIEAAGSEIGKSSVGLLRDIAAKAMDAVGHAGDQAAREAILGDLKRTDSVLAGADDATLMEAYHTMTRFAPVLSTDKNAVRSFLRQAVMSGAGPDFMSIKLLADSERAVTGGNDKRAAVSEDVALQALMQAAAEHAQAQRPHDIMKSTAIGGLAGAGLGALGGAMSDDKHRGRNALIGGAAGGALGAGSGALSEWLFPQLHTYEWKDAP